MVAECHPRLALPAPSTIGARLKREGLIRPRKRRLRVPWSTQPLDPCHDPNARWCIDFKGHFARGDRSRGYPLTVTDAFSRSLLVCEARGEGKEGPVRAALERAFREFGLPERINPGHPELQRGQGERRRPEATPVRVSPTPGPGGRRPRTVRPMYPDRRKRWPDDETEVPRQEDVTTGL